MTDTKDMAVHVAVSLSETAGDHDSTALRIALGHVLSRWQQQLIIREKVAMIGTGPLPDSFSAVSLMLAAHIAELKRCLSPVPVRGGAGAAAATYWCAWNPGEPAFCERDPARPTHCIHCGWELER